MKFIGLYHDITGEIVMTELHFALLIANIYFAASIVAPKLFNAGVCLGLGFMWLGISSIIS